MRTDTGGMLFCLFILYLLFVFSISSVRASMCTDEPIYYASQCLARPGCGWCCEQPFGHQCFDLGSTFSPIPFSCRAGAYLTNPNTTCGQLCELSKDQCDSCEVKNWCYYCISNSSCQPSYAECRNSQVIQSCSKRNEVTRGISYFTVLIYAGIGLFLFALILAMVVLYLRLRERLRREHPRLEEPLMGDDTDADQRESSTEGADRTPFPAPDPAIGSGSGSGSGSGAASNAPLPHATAKTESPEAPQEAGVHMRMLSGKPSAADEESLCSICLCASPSVTFLPCYHTCCCEACSMKIRPVDDTLKCPFCRVRIKAMVNLYNVMLQIDKWALESG